MSGYGICAITSISTAAHLRECTDLDGGTGRERLTQKLSIGGVDRREIAHARDVDRRPHRVREVRSRRFEDRREILHALPRLVRDGAGDELAGGGIDAELAGAVHDRVEDNRLGVRSDRLRRLGGSDCAFLCHVFTYRRGPGLSAPGGLR
jgi:hypothetical protein